MNSQTTNWQDRVSPQLVEAYERRDEFAQMQVSELPIGLTKSGSDVVVPVRLRAQPDRGLDVATIPGFEFDIPAPDGAPWGWVGRLSLPSIAEAAAHDGIAQIDQTRERFLQPRTGDGVRFESLNIPVPGAHQLWRAKGADFLRLLRETNQLADLQSWIPMGEQQISKPNDRVPFIYSSGPNSAPGSLSLGFLNPKDPLNDSRGIVMPYYDLMDCHPGSRAIFYMLGQNPLAPFATARAVEVARKFEFVLTAPAPENTLPIRGAYLLNDNLRNANVTLADQLCEPMGGKTAKDGEVWFQAGTPLHHFASWFGASHEKLELSDRPTIIVVFGEASTSRDFWPEALPLSITKSDEGIYIQNAPDSLLLAALISGRPLRTIVPDDMREAQEEWIHGAR